MGVFSGADFLARAAALLPAAEEVEGSAPPAATGTPTIDTIFINGNFLLAVPAVPGEAVTAVAVGGGTIVDVGAADRIRKMQSPATKVVDLGGATLAPGFVDSHAHLLGAVENVYSTDLGQCTQFAEVIALITETVKNAHVDEWFFFVNFDPSRLEYTPGVGFKNLGFKELDPLSPNANLFVENASGHIAYGNTQAFNTAHVDATTTLSDGGSYGKDKDGKLTGVMFESSSFSPFQKNMPLEKVAEGGLPAILLFLKSAQERGITTIADPAVGVGGHLWAQLDVFSLLAGSSLTPVHVVGSIDLTSIYPVDGEFVSKVVPLKGTQQHVHEHTLVPPSKPGDKGKYGKLTIPNLKMWSDGSTQGYTAFVTIPYRAPVTPADLGPNGAADWEQGQMKELVGKAKEDNWSVLIHANGDAGLDLALTTLEAVYGPDSAYRNRIEHCTVTRPEQYDTMKRLGVTPSYLNNHVYTWGDTFYKNILGRKRAKRLDAAGDAYSRGMIFSFHCDYPTSLPDPLRYMQTAVTRQTSTGRVLGRKYAIPVLEALKAVTIHPAKQLGLDDRIGTIEVNKDANFVELAEDPTTVEPSLIASIVIKATWLRGRWIPAPVHDRGVGPAR